MHLINWWTDYDRVRIADTDKNFNTGIILVVLILFESQLLPRITKMKDKLDYGSLLNDFGIDYLSEALHDNLSLLPYMDNHSEYEAVFAKIIHYYKTIIETAISIEK